MAGCLFYNHSYTSSVNFDTFNMKYFIILALVAAAAADVSHVVRNADTEAQIITQVSDVLPDKYGYRYETSNGIVGQESGVLENTGREDEGIAVQGSSSYTAPDGQLIQVTYVADKNGYQAQGSHLPTPPPTQAIPEAILRSLKYIADHPPAPEAPRRV